MKENELQRAIIELAELLKWRVYHVSNVKGRLRSGTGVGFPDLVMVRPPRLIFAELKSAKGVLTTEQQQWMNAIWGTLGVEGHVWRPAQWFDGTIEGVLR